MIQSNGRSDRRVRRMAKLARRASHCETGWREEGARGGPHYTIAAVPLEEDGQFAIFGAFSTESLAARANIAYRL